MKALTICATLFLAIFGTAFTRAASVDDAVQSVTNAYGKVDARLRGHPPRTVRQKLEALYDEDQAGRAALHTLDMSDLNDANRKIAHDDMWEIVRTHDLTNQTMLKRLLPPSGWFSPHRYGAKAALGAFLVVQHAENDPALQHDVLRRIVPLVRSGDVRGEDYALLSDRLAISEGKPQRYGTQMICKGGRWVPAPLESVADVDALRAKLSLRTTFAEYVKSFAAAPPCVAVLSQSGSPR